MKIIIVDDDELARKLYALMLSEYQCEVSEASSGEEAIRQAKKSQPDLIISDHYLPGMTGYSVVKTFRDNERLRHVPIILLSALGIDESLEKLDPSEFQGFVAKPFSAAQFVQAIERAVHRPLSKKEG